MVDSAQITCRLHFFVSFQSEIMPGYQPLWNFFLHLFSFVPVYYLSPSAPSYYSPTLAQASVLLPAYLGISIHCRRYWSKLPMLTSPFITQPQFRLPAKYKTKDERGRNFYCLITRFFVYTPGLYFFTTNKQFTKDLKRISSSLSHRLH